eukprot:gene25773-biopygen15060
MTRGAGLNGPPAARRGAPSVDFGASVGRPRAGGWRRGGGVRFFHEFRRGTLIWHASREFAPRCEPHPARAKWGPMIRMSSGSSLALQRLSREPLRPILGVKVGGNDESRRCSRLRSPLWNWRQLFAGPTDRAGPGLGYHPLAGGQKNCGAACAPKGKWGRIAKIEETAAPQAPQRGNGGSGKMRCCRRRREK